ncbi:MAG: MarR family winged helix-turn-helix transcriptional regulator [Jatrophihabitantaceae bacterium]
MNELPVRPTEAVYAEMVVLARRLRRESALAHPALTITDYSILSYLDRQSSATVTDTAIEFGLNKSTASRQIAGLHERGLIVREGNPTDGRVGHLRPSATGRLVLQQARAELRAALFARLDGWPDDDIEQFAELLCRYNRQPPVGGRAD